MSVIALRQTIEIDELTYLLDCRVKSKARAETHRAFWSGHGAKVTTIKVLRSRDEYAIYVEAEAFERLTRAAGVEAE